MSKENQLVSKDVIFVNKVYKYSKKVQDVCQSELKQYHQHYNLKYQIQHIEQYAMHFFSPYKKTKNNMR